MTYRDKLRLSQLILQLGRKEEEKGNPQKRTDTTKISSPTSEENINSIEYIATRLLKLKPTKMKSLKNSIRAMYNFKGSISEKDEMKVISKLQKLKYIKIDDNKVSYLQ
ncbi:MAG: hypothetical protein U9R27_03400 [Campylobacterota bacterium]|nr:hypothetical protein [Campylobacterota bacterium]